MREREGEREGGRGEEGRAREREKERERVKDTHTREGQTETWEGVEFAKATSIILWLLTCTKWKEGGK